MDKYNKQKFIGAVLMALGGFALSHQDVTWFQLISSPSMFFGLLASVGAVLVAGRYVDAKSKDGE